MQLKQIISGAIGFIMAAATLAFPALAAATAPADWPEPYVKNNAADFTVVYGAAAAATDAAAANSIASALADQVVPTEGGGELTGGVDLSTSNTPLYLGDSWASARATLSKSQLSNVLGDGIAVASDGTEYDYKQYIELTNSSTGASYKDKGVLSFGRNGGLSDPVLNIEIGTASATMPYYTKVVFDKNLNVTNLGGEEIKLFGKNYVISSSSTKSSTLILFGAANLVTMKAREEQTVTVGGTNYLVKVVAVVDSNTATISVDGTSKDVDEGQTKQISGLDVYVDTVDSYQEIVNGVALDSGQVKLVLGSERLKFQDNNNVKVGAAEDTMDNSKVYMSWDTAGDLAEMRVNVSAASSDADFLSPGNCYTDRVWTTFKFCLGDVTPSLTSEERDKIVLKPVSSDTVRLEFTTADDVEFSQDIVNMVDVNSGWPQLQDADDHDIFLKECNKSASDYSTLHKAGPMLYGEKDYFFTNENSYSHFFQISDFVSVGSQGAKILLKDKLTDDTYEVTLDSDGYWNGSHVIDGNTFYFALNATSACDPTCGVMVTWGGGAAINNSGNAVSIFPQLETKSGAWISLTDNVTIDDTTYEIPMTGKVKEYGTVKVEFGTAGEGNGNCGFNATYASNALDMFKCVNASAYVTLYNQPEGPGILILEEKDDGELKNAIYTATGYDATNKRITVEETYFNMTQYNGAQQARMSVTSDNYIDKWVDRYGTFAIVTDSQDGGGMVEIYYPDEQAYWDVRVGEVGELVSTGEVATATAILDSAVTDSQRNTSNIIVVGGPCVNTLAAELLGKTFPACGSASGWAVGDQFITKYAGQFAAGNTALLVAGWEAADTTAAANALVAALA